MSNLVQTITTQVTIGASGTVPLVYLPSNGGDVTVIDAHITGAGTPVGLKLISMTGADLPVLSGTVASFGGTFAAGTITMGNGSAFAATINTARMDAGQWLALQNASGTVVVPSWITVSYVYGVGG